jgi:hypothetical protein
MRLLSLLTLFALSSAGSALAGPPPPADLSTEIIAPYIPPGWKATTVKGSPGRQELVEFTPADQTGETFTDLVGFTSGRHPPGASFKGDATQLADRLKSSQAQQCSTATTRTDVPAGARPGWVYVQLYCLLSSGPAAGKIDLTFQGFFVGPQNVYTVWRAWRGTPTEFRALIKARAGVDASPLTPSHTFDDRVLDRVTTPLLARWSDVFAAAQICDLASGSICDKYRAKGPVTAGTIAVLDIAGAHELTPQQAFEIQSHMAGPNAQIGAQMLDAIKRGQTPAKGAHFLQGLSLSDHDWVDPRRIVVAITMPMLGARADGGTLVARDDPTPADAQTRARMQVYIVACARMLWLLGVAPDRETIALSPAA